MVRPIFRATLLACTCAVVFCGKDYDPFTDLTNAKAHVLSWSFSGADSVPVQVYSTGTIQIGVAARDEVDSFCLHASRNRFWQDTTVRRKPGGSLLDASAYSFSVSFFDTGVQSVYVTTWRSNGESAAEKVSARVTFPLRQRDVSGFFGDSIALSTPAVRDNDVFYQWDFGGGRHVKSPRNSAKASFSGGPASGAATLWVSDVEGLHATPLSVFSYSLFDTSRPIILCANANLQNDTLSTRDSILAFIAYVANYGDITVDTCWVNQSAFDLFNPKSHLYTKVFGNMSGYSRQNALSITVHAQDYSGQNRYSTRTFWAVFDPSGPSSPGANISFVIPAEDSSTSGTRDLRIFGTAEDFLGDSMALRVTVDDSMYQAACIITGSGGTWEWPVHLGSYVNTITVTAYGAGSRILTSGHVIVAYDPTAQDRIKPLIWDISASGKPAGNLYTAESSVALQVTAFDEWSGIQALTINGALATPDSSGYIWRQTIGPLVHSPGGDTVDIRAVDRNQNVKDTSIVIFRNTAPVLASAPAFPASFCIDSSYTLRISSFDADNDSVSVVPISSPLGMVISKDGTVTWTPAAAQTGTDTLAVRLYDGYQYSAPIAWALTCVNCSRPVKTVRFTTRENAFPAVLQAGRDTLRVRLTTDSAETGLWFSAKFTDRNEVILANDTSPMLVWAPQAADTGYRTLRVTVGNGTAVFDTIVPAFWVVPKNQYPCSLSYIFRGDTTSAGQLDLYTHPIPETLFFVIHDLDNPLTERYTVTISQRSTTSIETLNNKNFFIALSPDTALTQDTIRVRLSDLTGTSDSETFVVRYSFFNPFAAWSYSRTLTLNTTPSGASVAGNVFNFPVLVRLTNNNFNFGQAQNTGSDIRFAKANGVPCSYQIERWDPAEQGGAEIWVKVDTVYGNNGTQSITMYWGNSAAASLTSGAAVFDTANNFKYVWHLEETGNNNAGNYKDATANANNGTGTGTPAQATGAIGHGQTFSGANYISTANYIGITTGQRTLSAWVNINNTSSPILGWGTGACNANQFYSFFWRTQYKIWACGVIQADYSAGTADTSGNWVYTTATYDGSKAHLFANGVEVGLGNTYSYATADTIGQIGFAKFDYYCKGTIDEARIENTARSADWIMLCYMNQKSPDALVVFK